MRRILLAVVCSLLVQSAVGAKGGDASSAAAPVGFPGVGDQNAWVQSQQYEADALRAMKAGDFSKAIENGKLAIKTYPQDPSYYNQLAVSYFQRHQQGDVDTGIKYSKEALKMRPKSLMYWENLARALAGVNRLGEAREALMKASECDPSSSKLEEIKAEIASLDRALAVSSGQAQR